MPRVKRGVISKIHHKNILKFSKGYRGRRKNVYRISKEAILKSLYYSFRDRIKKRKFFKKKFIIYINFILNFYNINYNFFIYNLKKSNLNLNKYILYKLFFFDKNLFFLILKKIKVFINDS
ncbi:50S ribosomal protein L20p [Candidatus Nasuia deltocephalinicola]|nr:50S ribosomal protein L20p [Candidatus Nasuia deltocephalinicola]